MKNLPYLVAGAALLCIGVLLCLRGHLGWGIIAIIVSPFLSTES